MDKKNCKNHKDGKNHNNYVELQRKQKRCNQKGSGSSDYSQLFHAWGADPAQLSRFTLANINKAPMFHPLQENTVIPTGTSGIIPTGSYYGAITARSLQNTTGPMTAPKAQMGGTKSGVMLYTTKKGKKITNPWIAHVYKFAEQHKLNYRQALLDPRVKSTYAKVPKRK